MVFSKSSKAMYLLKCFKMKYSIYNTNISITPLSLLLYNAVTDKFIVIKKQALNNLKIDCPTGEESLLYRMLKENGFVVGDEANEKENVIQSGKSFCDNKDDYYLIVNPTLNCNFRCWYCYENHSSKAVMTKETLDRVVLFVKKIVREGKVNSLMISFFGGEPLLYYKKTIEPIIDTVRLELQHNPKLRISFHFTSNGYLVNDYVLGHLLKGDEKKSFQITLDGNRSYHDKIRFSASGKGTYERIIGNIKRLLSSGIFVGLRFNYTKENILSFKDVISDIKKFSQNELRLLNIDFQKVWQEKDVKPNDYEVENTIDSFRELFPQVISHYNHICNYRNPCYADLKNECVINYNGDVYKCTARDFNPGKRLGRLLENGDIEWFDTEIYNKRLNSKFSNKDCLSCKIFPLCGGGCSQNAVENVNSGCIKGLSEEEKDKIVLTRFYNNIVLNKEKNDV